MPEQLQLIRQRGSVLAGVLVLSLAMTLAAAGMLLTNSFSASSQQAYLDQRKLIVAGESTLLLATRYMRRIPPASFPGFANNVVNGITTGYPNYTQLQRANTRDAMDDPSIRAAFEKIADTCKIMAWATYGRDTVLFSLRIASVSPIQFNGMTVFTFKDWKDTLLAYRP